ncbi:MAG: choice-of-anchor D domain-containing protein [Candidatus Kapaibacterium sp.]
MKQFLPLLLCFFCAHSLFGQSLNILSIDATNYPEVKAKFYAYDSTGKQQYPGINDFILKEDSIPRVITRVTCPPPAPPKILSSVLVMDVSESMKFPAANPNIEMAKAAARIWFQHLPANKGECAVTSFDDINYLNQDYTNDTSRLNAAINQLEPVYGTNYEAAFINPMAGGLLVSKNARFKKVIIMITDGQDTRSKNDSIIAEAIRQKCTVYCVTISMDAPKILKEIASKTGGIAFENIRTTQQIEAAYLKILDIAQGEGPCEITWNSALQCSTKPIKVNLQWVTQKADEVYSPPANTVSSIQIKPSNVYIKVDDFLTVTDKIITLTALKDSMRVLDVLPVHKYKAFSLLDGNFPRTIPQNGTATFTVRYTPIDSAEHYESYIVLTSFCSYTLNVKAGTLTIPDPPDSVYVPRKKNPLRNLKLTHPNGGETFVIGTDSVITWTGISPMDSVSLDYSIDSGKVWKNIVPKTTELPFPWLNIPGPASKKCLVRVRQLQERDSIEIHPTLVYKHAKAVTGVAFSPDGSFAITAGDSVAKLWDTDSGSIVRTFKGHTAEVTSLAYSQDGKSLITGSNDSTVKIWTIANGLNTKTLRDSTGKISAVACDFSSTQLATASEDFTAKVWDMKTGKTTFTLTGHTGIIYGIAYNSIGNRIATASSDKSIKIWNAYTGALMQTLTGHKGYVYAVAFSPDDTKLGSVSNDNTAKIWDLAADTVISSLVHGNMVTDLAFSPDGKQVITASRDYYTKVWDLATGAVVRMLGGSSSPVTHVKFSSDGKRILTGNSSKEAAVWDDVLPVQEDISDSTFTIVAPQPAATDVAMGLCAVGKNKDSTVTPFLWNPGTYPYRVKSISIAGQDAAQFTLISGIPPVDIAPRDSHAVEFRFRPTSPGVKTAQLIIYTQSDTLKRRITGEGVTPAISVLGNVIDFGKVLVNTTKDSLQTVTIRNSSAQPIVITSTRHAGPNMVDYSTLSGGGNFTLNPGDTAKLDLRFAPKYPGRTSGRILFEYDGIDSPIAVQLFGEGVKPGAQILAAGLTIPPVVCSSETTDTVRIFNRGTDTLRVTSAVISGSNSSDFQFVNPFTSFSLLPDSMMFLPVKFAPASSGIKTAILELRSNSLVDTLLRLPLTGQKDIVAFSTNIQKIDLGTLCPNEARDTSITLTNTGTLRSTYLVQSPIIHAELTDSTLNSSGSTSIKLQFPGRASEGFIDEIITITDTLCGSKSTVQVIGNIQLPRLTYPAFVDFGAVASGATSTLDIVAVNKDARSITIAQPTGITAPFTIISLTPLAGSVLASGDTLRVRVQYSATGSVPNSQMIHWSTITPCTTLDSTELRVSGITHTLLSVATVTFDSVCVGQSRQLKAKLSNTGSTPLQLLRAEWITNAGSTFSTTVTPAKILAPGTTDSLDVTFTPSASGLVNADLRWVADVDTAFTTVSGIGKICAANLDTARTTIIAPNITAKAGEKVNLTLTMTKPTGMEILGAPTEWVARIHYNKSILFNEQTSNVCPGTTDSCALELTGVYNPKSEKLITIPCIATLGNTDHSTIVIDTFFWKNSAIVTEVATQNGSITLNGICEDGGVRLFIPAKTSTSLSTRPNPAQDNLQIQYGLREPLTVTLELLTMTGQVVQTILTNQTQVAGQYTLTSDLSSLGNGVYLLRLRTNKEMLTTRVDVVK